MDDESMNRYEKQLYTVFKTFDVDNEEALDRSSVRELCDVLQLEDRGAALVNTLFDRQSDRVTFAQFRNGLLAVLGGAGGDSAATAVISPAPQPHLGPTPKLNSPAQSDLPPQHSDDDSSGREVAPKFIFGSKKYGRRSRPPRASTGTTELPSPRSSSASRLDTEDKKERQRMRCRRSASAMESRNDNGSQNVCENYTTEPFEHNRRIDRDQALELCHDLHMDSIDQGLVERIFEDSGATDTTVGEFFDRLNASLTSTIAETSSEVRTSAIVCDNSNDTGDDEVVGIPIELVQEAWESAGIQQPRRLLLELGFAAASLRPPELERSLDDELRALPDPMSESRDARSILLAAALALNRLRLELACRRAELITAERDKLRSDVVEANRRAGLLAQEVDESQARIEAESKATMRRMEARQAEVARQSAAEQAVERERAAAIRSRLEAEVTRRSDAEARLRGELNIVRKRMEELESLTNIAEERSAESERERARLTAELRTALEDNAAVEAQRAESNKVAVCLHDLRAENKRLRDRNDELCAALEATTRTTVSPPCNSMRGGDLSAELNSLIMQNRPEECDSAPMSIDQRILGHSETMIKLRLICESITAITFVNENSCESCGTVHDTIRRLQERVRDLSDALLVPELHRAHAVTQTDNFHDSEVMRHDFFHQECKHEDEKHKLTSLVKDLETSLEQMKAEYDKCEEYWNTKLEEERDAYTEEQRIGDERLAELVAKINEYERQFASAPTALPTIDERYSLEVQFTDLEEEFAHYRRDKEAELQASTAECARLMERIDTLERRLAAIEAERAASPGPRRRPRDYHNPAYYVPRTSNVPDAPRDATRLPEPSVRHVAEVRELRARCARAETAVRRLHSRLAAADVLVKELYVENCQLAHRRPL